MLHTPRKRVKSTPFSDFFRYAKSSEKRQFFDRIAREAIKEQQEIIERAKKIRC